MKRNSFSVNTKKKPRVNPNNIDVMSNPKAMEREAINIFISIARGNYDINYVYQMFSNPMFMKSAIKVASEKYTKADIHRQAMEYAYNGSEDINVIEVYNDDHKKCIAWKIILDCLYAIINTGDATLIYNLSNQLTMYKQNI